MRPIHVLTLLLCALAIALVSPQARAQDQTVAEAASTNPREQAAREEFARGAEAYAAGRYRQAVNHFAATQQLAPNPALSYNIALAYDAMGDSPSALRHYRDYLRAAPDAEDRLEVAASIRRLEQRLADWGVQQLTVTSSPPGAALLIDGRAVGITPWTGELAPGRHQLQAKLDDHVPASLTISLVEDRALDVNLELSAAPLLGPEVMPPADSRASTQGPSPSRRRRQLNRTDAAALGTFTLGAGAFITALALEQARAAAEDDAKTAPTQVAAAAELDTINRRRLAARIATGVGAGLVTTGAILFAVGRRSRTGEDHAAVTVAIGAIDEAWGLRLGGKLP